MDGEICACGAGRPAFYRPRLIGFSSRIGSRKCDIARRSRRFARMAIIFILGIDAVGHTMKILGHNFIRFIAISWFFLSACSAHNPLIITNTTQSTPVGQNKYSAHNDRVFITTQSLPASLEFDLLSTIDVGNIWYGSSANVYTSMADRARELGANAIIQAKTWHQPSGFSWAAPHGSGQAVRIKDISILDSMGIKGSWH